MGHQELLASFTVKPLKVINFRVYGKRTAIKLEPSVYDALLEICERELIDSEELINNIRDRLLEVKGVMYAPSEKLDDDTVPAECQDEPVAKRPGAITLTTAIRAFTLAYYRRLALGPHTSHDSHASLDSTPIQGSAD